MHHFGCWSVLSHPLTKSSEHEPGQFVGLFLKQWRCWRCYYRFEDKPSVCLHSRQSVRFVHRADSVACLFFQLKHGADLLSHKKNTTQLAQDLCVFKPKWDAMLSRWANIISWSREASIDYRFVCHACAARVFDGSIPGAACFNLNNICTLFFSYS